MRKQTTKRYIQTVTQFLAFTLRAVLQLQELQLKLPPLTVAEGNALIAQLENETYSGAIEKSIHQLIMVILNRIRQPEDQFDCPVAYFIMYMSVLPSGKIHHPGEVNGTLTELKWPFRASTFWEVVEKSKIESNNGNPEM